MIKFDPCTAKVTISVDTLIDAIGQENASTILRILDIDLEGSHESTDTRIVAIFHPNTGVQLAYPVVAHARQLSRDYWLLWTSDVQDEDCENVTVVSPRRLCRLGITGWFSSDPEVTLTAWVCRLIRNSKI